MEHLELAFVVRFSFVKCNACASRCVGKMGCSGGFRMGVNATSCANRSVSLAGGNNKLLLNQLVMSIPRSIG